MYITQTPGLFDQRMSPGVTPPLSRTGDRGWVRDDRSETEDHGRALRSENKGQGSSS